MKSVDRTGKDTNGSAKLPETAIVTSEATIDQVRDLLFGGAQRSLQSDLATLHNEMQSSLSKVREEFAKELASVQMKLHDLEQDVEQKRLASLRDVGAAIADIGKVISGLGSGGAGK